MTVRDESPLKIANDPEFRPDLAFTPLTEAMVERLRTYGKEESYPTDSPLFTHGDRGVDMFVILQGEVDVSLPPSVAGCKTIWKHRRFAVAGELNLLTTQACLVDGKTVGDTTVLRISRQELQRLMREEGDIANLITSAVIWRRIGILGEETAGVTLIGHSNDAATRELQRFLVRNSYPHRVAEPSSMERATSEVDAGLSRFPTVVLSDGRSWHKPTISGLADELGITELPDPGRIYDVAIVGAGPSGLAAAVYAASEGLCTIVIEGVAPGGQAGTSSKIENYLGFPTGVSGLRLASRAQLQALKFGVSFAISRETVRSEEIDGIHQLTLAGGIPVRARSVVVASGAQYRTLSVENYRRYENCGIYYAATAMESVFCRDKEVVVVGGGNSAGQAALFLSGIAKHVHHLVRTHSLAKTMSQYLISRIEKSPNITLHTRSEIVALDGDLSLDQVKWVHHGTGVITAAPVSNVFVMIGAEPNSGWLFGSVTLDKKGFILTGGSVGFENTPYATSMRGMFAVGDVRAQSVKRVASAVGEGSVVISDVHRYLADHRNSLAAERNSALAALRSANAAAAHDTPDRVEGRQ
ncbi:cyclic nucleotide-binding domain-containing protein [Granulicella sp. WH15]|nr:cyclic nucleotide-binding domain-containing protein [Granulicella sp. WH15]